VSALAVNRSLTFNELKALLKTTDGNLKRAREEAGGGGLTSCARNRFDGRLPKTEIPAGRWRAPGAGAYLNHMEALIRATREG